MEQQREIREISDLELAELLAAQMLQLFQSQQNVNALQAELNRRKQTPKETQQAGDKPGV
jgi:hypothetical protein